MKGQIIKGWKITAALLGTALIASAQTAGALPGTATAPAQNTGTASATQGPAMPPPGTVNYLEGQVSLNGEDLSRGSVRSTVVGNDQTISTGNGYVEVLLTPGAYLRLGHNGEARMISAGLADTRFELTRGTALVEVAQLIKGSQLTVQADGATTTIESKGLYSFDAGTQSVAVLDGKARVSGQRGETTLKKGDKILLASEQPFKKLDLDEKVAKADPLYVWSKVRSHDEAAANAKLADTLLARGGGWYAPGWYWDPYFSFYSFVPAWGSWYSPFGFGLYPGAYGFYSGFGYPGYYGGRVFYRGGLNRGFAGAHAVGGFRASGGFHAGGGFHGGRR